MHEQFPEIKPDRKDILFPVAIIISLLGLILSFIAYFPAGMSWDSFVMWGMGWQWLWHDWHPPYIALLMTISRIFRDDPAVYLFFQLFFHWAGLYLFAAAMRKTVGNWALIIPMIGFTPMLLGLSGLLQKTPLQTAIFLFVFGVIFFHHAWNKRLNNAWMTILIIILIFSIPLREYAYLCIIPIVAYLLYVQVRCKKAGFIMLYFTGAIAISVVSLAVKNFVTYDVLHAQKLYKVQTLYKYDLAAIYAQTGVDFAPELIREKFSDPEAVRKEYDTYDGLWRIMNIYQGGIAPGLMANHLDTWKRALTPRELDYFQDAWLRAISTYPDIWIAHKVHAFMISLGYEYRMKGISTASRYQVDQNIFELKKSHNFLSDTFEMYMKSMQACVCQKPWFWFLVTHAMIIIGAILWFRVHALREILLPNLVLLSSASMFYMQYFIISLSNDYRFTYWAITATVMGSFGIFLIISKNIMILKLYK